MCTSSVFLALDRDIAAQVEVQPNTKRLIKWASSKRLLFGSLVCLSDDGFRTFLHGELSAIGTLICSQRKNAIEITFPFNRDAFLTQNLRDGRITVLF